MPNSLAGVAQVPGQEHPWPHSTEVSHGSDETHRVLKGLLQSFCLISAMIWKAVMELAISKMKDK